MFVELLTMKFDLHYHDNINLLMSIYGQIPYEKRQSRERMSELAKYSENLVKAVPLTKCLLGTLHFKTWKTNIFPIDTLLVHPII